MSHQYASVSSATLYALLHSQAGRRAHHCVSRHVRTRVRVMKSAEKYLRA